MNDLPKGRLEVLFQALADRTRLRVLNLLATQEMCVCYFVEALRTTQPKISRHLAYLRRSGLVQTRRDGKWMHYQLRLPSDAHASRLFCATLEILAQDRQMQKDRARLSNICQTPQKFVQLQGAPPPQPLPCCLGGDSV